MEQVLRKIVQNLVLMCAYIPLGAASVAFIGSAVIYIKHIVVWVKKGAWTVPRLFELFDNMDFLSVLMDDRISGFRLILIKSAAKTANLPVPVFLLIFGSLCLCTGIVLLHFARAIKQAGIGNESIDLAGQSHVTFPC